MVIIKTELDQHLSSIRMQIQIIKLHRRNVSITRKIRIERGADD